MGRRRDLHAGVAVALEERVAAVDARAVVEGPRAGLAQPDRQELLRRAADGVAVDEEARHADARLADEAGEGAREQRQDEQQVDGEECGEHECLHARVRGGHLPTNHHREQATEADVAPADERLMEALVPRRVLGVNALLHDLHVGLIRREAHGVDGNGSHWK